MYTPVRYNYPVDSGDSCERRRQSDPILPVTSTFTRAPRSSPVRNLIASCSALYGVMLDCAVLSACSAPTQSYLARCRHSRQVSAASTTPTHPACAFSTTPGVSHFRVARCTRAQSHSRCPTVRKHERISASAALAVAAAIVLSTAPALSADVASAQEQVKPASNSQKELFDASRYVGRWYEVASLKKGFASEGQEDCHCTQVCFLVL